METQNQLHSKGSNNSWTNLYLFYNILLIDYVGDVSGLPDCGTLTTDPIHRFTLSKRFICSAIIMMDESKEKSKEKPKVVQRKVGFFELYSFATRWEWCLLVVAFVAAFLKSLVFPVIIIVYSELVAMFVDRNLCLPTTKTYFLPVFGGGNYL